MEADRLIGERLAKALLTRLRERLLSRQKIFGSSEIDLAQTFEKVSRDLRIPVC